MSFAKIVQRFKESMATPPNAAAKSKHDPRLLATAAVLLEIAYADGTFTPAEDGNIVGYLKQAFALDDESARDLMKAADEIRNHTIDHFALTNYIRKNVALAERLELVKTMWRISYSDGKLSEYENYLVRKLADLLGIEHKAMIDAKVTVLRERGEPA